MKMFRIFNLKDNKYLNTEKFKYLSTFAIQSGDFIFESSVELVDSNNTKLYANDIIECDIGGKIFHLWISIPKNEIVVSLNSKVLGNFQLLAHLAFENSVKIKKLTEYHFYKCEIKQNEDEFWDALKISEALKECYKEFD